MISLQTLRETLNLDERSGRLFWREGRPRHHFKTDRAFKAYISRDAGKAAGSRMKGGYLAVAIGRKKYLAHRLVYALHHGIEPENLPAQIDHIDRQTANNRPANLRPATSSENLYNSGLSSSNTSGFKGVSWHSNNMAWAANIKVCCRKRHLGYFATPQLAAAARAAAANDLHGAFARTA